MMLYDDSLRYYRGINERRIQIIFIQTAFSGNLLASSIKSVYPSFYRSMR